MRAAQEEAAQALGDMAKDAARGIGDSGSARQMAIEVRDDNGLVLEAKFVLEIDRYRK